MGFPYPRFLGPYQRTKLYDKTRPGANGCIEWTGFVRDGYPYMKVHGVSVGAHRVAWVLHNNKEIPDGYEIDHLCCNKRCVNPEHLEPVTRRENLRRRHGFTPLPPGGDDKVCRLCGRGGHRGFRFENNKWYCSNEASCRRRVERRETGPVWVRCGDCRHQRRRHDAAGRCLVVNCKCEKWWQHGDDP